MQYTAGSGHRLQPGHGAGSAAPTPAATLARVRVKRDPQMESSGSTRTSRRRSSATATDNDDDDDDDSHDHDHSSTSRRRRPKTRTAASATSTAGLATRTDPLLRNLATGTIQSYDSASFQPGGSASAALAADSTTSLPAAGGDTGLAKPALYSIIGGAVVFVLAVTSLLTWYFHKRRIERKREDDWLAGPPNAIFGQNSTAPGKGPGAKGERLPDDDDKLSHGLEKPPYGAEYAVSPFDEKQDYGFAVVREDADAVQIVSTPILTYNQGFAISHPVTSPSDPNYVPARPARPSAAYSFSSSPVKPIQHHRQLSTKAINHARNQSQHGKQQAHEQGMDTYQRNLMALTTSMSFGSTPIKPDNTSPPLPAAQPETSPFADSQAVSLQKKPSRRVDNKKDTIIGFAESYADDGDDEAGDGVGQGSDEPIRPLTHRGQTGASSGLQRSASTRSKAADVAPTLANLDLGLPSSTSSTMRDLEEVLDSFNHRSGDETHNATSDHQTPLVHGNRAPNRNLLSPVSNGRAGYKMARPVAGVGVSVVSNINSIHSTAGDIGETSPIQAQFPSSASLAGLASSAATGGISRSTTSPALSSSAKRRSTTSNKARHSMVLPASSGLSSGIPVLVRTDSRNSTGEVLVSANTARKRMSTTTFLTSGDAGFPASASSPFDLEADANLARALSLTRKRSESTRQRSVSVNTVTATRQPRMRTSTAYGGQMPPTPALDDGTGYGGNAKIGRLRTRTTDSEAVFALGSHMLSASPNTPDDFLKSPAAVPYFAHQQHAFQASPDLHIQPPSPSQSSQMTSFSALDREREYHRQLAENGFVPLGQMALTTGTQHDRHYRSPIDSIMGVFEFDDPRHSALIAGERAQSTS